MLSQPTVHLYVQQHGAASAELDAAGARLVAAWLLDAAEQLDAVVR